MVVKTKEKRMVEVVVDAHCVCDICNKEIKPGYHQTLTVGHNEWGNDSVDSIERLDICSDKCLQKEFNDYIKGTGRYEGIPRWYFEVHWGIFRGV